MPHFPGHVQQGTVIDPTTGLIPEDTRSDRQRCTDSGGFWDAQTRTCLPGKPPEPPKKEPKTLPLGIDPRTGEKIEAEEEKPFEIPKGFEGNIITDAQGNRRLQRTEDVALEEAEFGGIGAAQALQEKQVRIAEQQRIAQIISTIGTIGKLTPAQEAEINKSQALVAGTVGQIPSILATAGTFAVGGAIAGGPVGAAIGAAVGIVAGIARGILGNIKEQQRGELQAADIELTNARTNMRQLSMLASQDPQNADVYIQQYNAQLTRIHQARRQTKAEVTGDINAFMEDGREQLADFDAFLIEGGIADVYGQKLAIALSLGVPIDVSGEEFLP